MNLNSNKNNNPSKYPIPDDNLLRRIQNSNATITETKAYYQQLSKWLEGNYGSHFYNKALDHFFYVEMILNSIDPDFTAQQQGGGQTESTVPGESTTSATPQAWRPKTILEIQQEILNAAASTSPQIVFTQIAAANGFPLSLVELWAEQLLKDEGLCEKFKIVENEYENCISAMRQIELEIDDPGLRKWKLQDLARKYRRTEKQLREAFTSSLISQVLTDPVSYQELLATHSEKRNWVMRGWIPEGALVLLYSPGGVGKTLFAHHIIKQLVTGENWGDYRIAKGGVLYIQADTPTEGMLAYFAQTGMPNDVPFQIHTNWEIDHTPQLYQWIKQYRPKLVVVDSLFGVSRNCVVSENDTEYARPILYMGEIAREFRSSFLIIHHANSSGEQRGTKAIRAAVDEVWKLECATKDPSDPNRVLSIEKSRSRVPMKYKLKFDEDDYSWEMLGEVSEDESRGLGNNTCRAGIIQFLETNDGWFAIEEIAVQINFSKDTVRKEIQELQREALVNRKPNPAYKRGRGNTEPKHYYSL